jgi:AcrR family transcriptional regulator
MTRTHPTSTGDSTAPQVDRRELHGDFAQREQLLLREARGLLRDSGYDGLSLKVLSERTGMARVTVYKHFRNRAEIILKLAIQSTARRADLAEQAALFKGLTRERLTGVVSVLQALLPFHLRHELLVYEAGVRNRASKGLLRELQAHEDRILAVLNGVIREAVVAEDVSLPEYLPPERFGLAVVHLVSGGQLHLQKDFGYGRHTAADSERVLQYFGALVLDQLGWRPFSHEHDYVAATNRMWREVFPDLVRRFDVEP